MKHYIQLKDGIAFNYLYTPNEIATSENIIEIGEEGDSVVGKKYENGSFVTAPIIKYAVLDNNNTVIAIKTTIFSSEVGNNKIIDSDLVQVFWKWDGSKFVESI